MRQFRGLVVLAAISAVILPVGAASAASAGGPSISVVPAAVVGVGLESMFGLAIEGSGWYNQEAIQVVGDGLVNVCGGASDLGWVSTGTDEASTGSASAMTDGDGTFVVGLVAENCPPGNYLIQAIETKTPNRATTASIALTVRERGGPAVTLAPTHEAATTIGRSVATTIIVEGLAPGESVTVGSKALTKSCSSVSGLSLTGAETLALPAVVNADADGQIALALLGVQCRAGTDKINLREQGGKVHRATVTFTVS